MKKQLLTSLCAFLLVFSLCMGCSKAETGDKTTASDSFEVSSQKTSPVKITLNEVAHSVFYAPLYVAIEKGYFKDENIDLTLVTGFGADKTMTAVISGVALSSGRFRREQLLRQVPTLFRNFQNIILFFFHS